MVKKVVSWNNVTDPNTTFQVHKYIETCKDWLITAETTSNTEKIIPVSNTINSFNVQQYNNIGICGGKTIHEQNEFACLSCKLKTLVKNGKLICTNPFTCASSGLICNQCSAVF